MAKNSARRVAAHAPKTEQVTETRQEVEVQAEQTGEQIAQHLPETEQTEAPVLGKYEKITAAAGGPDKMPSGFKYSSAKLVIGSNKPMHDESVMGRIYGIVAKKPGLTGAELVVEMQKRRDWNETGAKIKYAANGVVCAAWAIGYVNGSLRAKNGFLQVVEGTKTEEAA